jgi:hypothetical protein
MTPPTKARTPADASRSRPFRWIETETRVLFFRAPERSAGVGLSLRRVPTVSVTATLTADHGLRVTSLHAGGISNTDLQRLMANGDTITSSEILKWLTELRLAWLASDDDDLHKLEAALNIMRVTERTPDHVGIAHRTVKTDLKSLLCSLPELISFQLEDFAMAPQTEGAIRHGRTVLKVFEDLLIAARHVDKFLGRRKAPRAATWLNDALWIATYLRALGQKSGRRVGLTKADSPAVRLIRHALKRALPNEPFRCANIAQSLHRHKDLIEPKEGSFAVEPPDANALNPDAEG